MILDHSSRSHPQGLRTGVGGRSPEGSPGFAVCGQRRSHRVRPHVRRRHFDDLQLSRHVLLRQQAAQETGNHGQSGWEWLNVTFQLLKL